MSTDIIKSVYNDNNDSRSIIERDKLEKLIEKKKRAEAEKFFEKVLHLNPIDLPKLYEGIKVQDGNPYIPISFVEMLLDEIFFGQWKTHSFTGQQIANEVVGSLILEYKHPVTNEWIQRVGVAGKQIQQKSKTPINQFVEYKYPNALEKIWPAMKSECIKNGAKSIGKLFGRDLGRKDNEQSPYTPLMGDERREKAKKDLDDILNGSDAGDAKNESDKGSAEEE